MWVGVYDCSQRVGFIYLGFSEATDYLGFIPYNIKIRFSGYKLGWQDKKNKISFQSFQVRRLEKGSSRS